ncbi:MAG: transposase [Gemmatimonadaceae bacterium]
MKSRDRQRRFTATFKMEAVRLMHERLATGLTLERVSKELDVDPDLLRVGQGGGRCA